jgi:hypothetical protein
MLAIIAIPSFAAFLSLEYFFAPPVLSFYVEARDGADQMQVR